MLKTLQMKERGRDFCLQSHMDQTHVQEASAPVFRQSKSNLVASRGRERRLPPAALDRRLESWSAAVVRQRAGVELRNESVKDLSFRLNFSSNGS